MIRAVVIDDSPTACRAVAGFLRGDPRFGLVATATDPAMAARVVAVTRPDVVTLDLEMPAPGGLRVLETVMAETPTPVVVVTGVSRAASASTLRACELGAIDFLLKYAPGRNTDPDTFRRELIAKTVAAAGLRLLGKLPEPRAASAAEAEPRGAAATLVIIGASTGGPPAIRELLAELPRDFCGGILIAQHLPAGFTQALAAQLARFAPGPVREAHTGDELRPGVTLVAPGGCNTTVRSDGRLVVTPAPAAELTPSIDRLVTSAAAVYGSRLHAVVLSGMGADGAAGLATARALGAATYAQEPTTCVVSGMPERAVERGAVAHVATATAIGKAVAACVGVGFRSARVLG